MADFSKALKALMRAEGGYVLHKVSWRSWRAHLCGHLATQLEGLGRVGDAEEKGADEAGCRLSERLGFYLLPGQLLE